MVYSTTDYVDRLEQFVWRLLPMAKRGRDLIGLGEVISALSEFAPDDDSKEVSILVGLTLEFRLKYDGIESGAIYGVTVSDEGVQFDVTELHYNPKFGSDNSTFIHAFIGWDGRASGDPMNWFEGAEALIGDDDVKLRVSRDHA